MSLVWRFHCITKSRNTHPLKFLLVFVKIVKGESGSLGLLAAQYSSSEEEEEASSSHTQKESTSWETLPVPDAILGLSLT